MNKSLTRRVLGALGVMIAAQLLSGCIVLPLPMHGGYHGGYHHDSDWRR